MKPAVQIQLDQVSDTITIIHLRGDLTASAKEALNEAYQQASQSGAQTLILHFRRDDYINSAGLGLLIDLVAEARKQEQKLLVVMPEMHFRKIFQSLGLTQYMALFETLETALSAIEANEQSDTE